MDRLVAMLRAAGDPTRLRLLLLLRQAELTVSELIEIVGQTPAARLPPSQAAGRGRAAGALQGRQLGVLPRRRPGQGRRTGRGHRRRWPIRPRRRPTRRGWRMCARRAPPRRRPISRPMRAEWERIRALHAPEKDVEAAIVRTSDGAADRESCWMPAPAPGRMLELLAPHVKRAVGIDVSPEMLAIARDRLLRAQCHACAGAAGRYLSPAVSQRRRRCGFRCGAVPPGAALSRRSRRRGGGSRARDGAGRAAADRRFRAA